MLLPMCGRRGRGGGQERIFPKATQTAGKIPQPCTPAASMLCMCRSAHESGIPPDPLTAPLTSASVQRTGWCSGRIPDWNPQRIPDLNPQREPLHISDDLA